MLEINVHEIIGSDNLTSENLPSVNSKIVTMLNGASEKVAIIVNLLGVRYTGRSVFTAILASGEIRNHKNRGKTILVIEHKVMIVAAKSLNLPICSTLEEARQLAAKAA